MKVMSKSMYKIPFDGVSVTGNLVEVIGEQVVKLESGKEVEQYIYNIHDYTPENGQPFVALKVNITIL